MDNYKRSGEIPRDLPNYIRTYRGRNTLHRALADGRQSLNVAARSLCSGIDLCLVAILHFNGDWGEQTHFGRHKCPLGGFAADAQAIPLIMQRPARMGLSSNEHGGGQYTVVFGGF